MSPTSDEHSYANEQGATEVKSLLQRGRSTTFDWFDAQPAVAAIALTMAAMANSQGGMLVIGIVSEGRQAIVAGIQDRGEIIDRILQAAVALDPTLIIPLPRSIIVDGKTVVAVRVSAGLPHVYAYEGRYLVRQGTVNLPLNPRELRTLLMQRGEFSFEAALTPGATREDLDWDRVHHYANTLSLKSDPEQLLIRRGCLTQNGDQLRPTNAGILLFGKDPQRFIRGADITAARFAGTTMSDRFSRQDLVGTLPEQIRRSETFLLDHLRKDVTLTDSMERQERYEVPMEAARELVVNAVAHRDYSISGDGIRLFLFKDRMEVTSPGGLPGPVTVANIKDERFSRNPIIVQVLSDMGFIERLGYGINRVIELMHQQDLREPEFKETGSSFKVALFNQERLILSVVRAKAAELNGEFSGEYNGLPVNARQEAAIAFLRQPGTTRITNSELQKLFPDVHAETIRRDLADLVTKNILSKMGEKRGSYYVMKRLETQPE
ncbi:MAG: ATP-binding protein [bacterium]|nr:ATP-binding protein [bacterium]